MCEIPLLCATTATSATEQRNNTTAEKEPSTRGQSTPDASADIAPALLWDTKRRYINISIHGHWSRSAIQGSYFNCSVMDFLAAQTAVIHFKLAENLSHFLPSSPATQNSHQIKFYIRCCCRSTWWWWRGTSWKTRKEANGHILC